MGVIVCVELVLSLTPPILVVLVHALLPLDVVRPARIAYTCVPLSEQAAFLEPEIMRLAPVGHHQVTLLRFSWVRYPCRLGPNTAAMGAAVVVAVVVFDIFVSKVVPREVCVCVPDRPACPRSRGAGMATGRSAEQGLLYGLLVVHGPGPRPEAGVERHVADLHDRHLGPGNQSSDGVLGVLHARGPNREPEVARPAPPEPVFALRPLLSRAMLAEPTRA